MRLRVGVLGGRVVDALEEVVGRWGETGRRGEGGVTSVWRIEVNIALACSVGKALGLVNGSPEKYVDDRASSGAQTDILEELSK